MDSSQVMISTKSKKEILLIACRIQLINRNQKSIIFAYFNNIQHNWGRPKIAQLCEILSTNNYQVWLWFHASSLLIFEILTLYRCCGS